MAASVEKRLAALEAEVAKLKERLDAANEPKKDWLKGIVGAFANDPAFEEAMKLGRRWRESFQPSRNRNVRKNSG
jgi:hypothetical protein